MSWAVERCAPKPYVWSVQIRDGVGVSGRSWTRRGALRALRAARFEAVLDGGRVQAADVRLVRRSAVR